MEVFQISSDIKKGNMQYWGRELGMCWQRLVYAVFKSTRDKDFEHPKRYGSDEPYDLKVGEFVIDTKYRIGSGDAGTLKKFKTYGEMLKAEGLKPVILILREDNLTQAVQACRTGGWTIYIGDDAFDFILKETNGFDLKNYLENSKGSRSIVI